MSDRGGRRVGYDPARRAPVASSNRIAIREVVIVTVVAATVASPVEPFTLEPRTVAHADALFPVLADPSLFTFIGTPAPASVDALRAQFARSQSRRSPDGTEHWLNWVVRTAAGDAAGTVQATIKPDGDTVVAYVMGRAFQGRGLAGAAVARMIENLAADFDVRRMVAVVDRGNTRSIALVTRLGFAPLSGDDAERLKMAPNDIVFVRSPT